MEEKGVYEFLQGSEAIVKAALKAGCKFYAGYPITPANEIMELMAKAMPRVKGIFIQAEDEIAAINMIIGASWAGLKAMTATSGPGFSLMQEGIGYAIMTETPIVVVDVMRTGPSTGQATKSAQGDLMQAIWGRHGDQALIVLSPNSVQEAYTLTVKAFNLSEEFRVPTVLLTEELIVHLRERITIPKPDELHVINRRKLTSPTQQPFGSPNPKIVPPMPEIGMGHHVLVTGSTHNEYGYRYTSDPNVHKRLVSRLLNKLYLNLEKIVDYEAYMLEDAEICIVAFGIVSRACVQAVNILRRMNVKVGLFRPKTLWPFPCDIFKKTSNISKIVVVEMNLKQLYYIVTGCKPEGAEVFTLNKIGGGIPVYPSEIVSFIKSKVI